MAKTYLKGSAKAKTFDNGGSVINLSLHADELITLATEHRNAAGYLNLVVGERREVGKYGDTHSVWLDDFVPKANDAKPKPLPPVQRERVPGDELDEDIKF